MNESAIAGDPSRGCERRGEAKEMERERGRVSEAESEKERERDVARS